ncbi:MAG: family 10 glycosylhydrolase [Ignavibacteriaceae bacterium]|nr:family 10 glycosylhydrolase [Ignavibacteriaceae bacterium]
MKKIVYYLFIVLFCNNLFSQPLPPKREFRGAWIATVVNYDWPSQPGLSTADQQTQLTALLDELKISGINAIFFQVRTECDALYQSSYEPWSYYLTGQQGVAPSPFYDPLEFVIKESHKRGMELHAWLNPYRAEKVIGAYPFVGNHITKTHPEWILQINTYKFLNPGIPQVTEYVTKIINDVARRYDIDGIHLDDYFYPYPPDQITDQDAATFQLYNHGITNIGDWRRENTTALIAQISDSLKSIKPYLKYGISPFGIWKSGVPAGITGMDAFNVIYADAMAWLKNGSVDYLAPQLYWPFGGGQDYAALNNWWSDSTSAYNRHLYVGQAAYKASSYGANEIPAEINFNRNNPKCQGSIFFRAGNFFENPKGMTDSLKYSLNRLYAIPPIMNWKGTYSVTPNAPSNLRYQLNPSSGKYEFMWNAPSIAAGGDTASRYVLYRFETSPSTLEDGNKIFGTTGELSLSTKYAKTISTSGNYFVVTALDRLENESMMSNVLQLNTDDFTPQIPNLISPANDDRSQKDSVCLIWKGDAFTYGYTIQVSTDSTFSSTFIVNRPEIKDTFFILKGILASTKYFWRIKAIGLGVNSDFSATSSFQAGFPNIPILVEPKHATTNVSLNPIFKWMKELVASSYRFQLATIIQFQSESIKADTIVTDTTLQIFNLAPLKNHFWRVSAHNEYGTSPWSSTVGFKTASASAVEDEKQIPDHFELMQNYPNPFNPATTIQFSLPNKSFVTLKIFDVLGTEVQTLIEGEKFAGNFTIIFDASKLASGIYFYKLQTDNLIAVKKLVVLK